MKRYLAGFGLTFLLVVTVQSFLGAKISPQHFILPIAAFLFLLIGIFVKKLRERKTLAVISSAVLFGALIFICFSLNNYNPAVKLADDSPHKVRAVFCDLPYKSGNIWSYLLKTETVDGAKKNVYFTLKTIHEYKIDPYDAIEAELTFQEEQSLSYIADRVYLSVYTNDIFDIVKTDGEFLNKIILNERRTLISAADYLFEERESSFVRAIFLGDKTTLSAELTEAFRAAGLSHVLVLSGMHMSIISCASLIIMRKIFRRRSVANFLAIIPIVWFMAITGFPPSLVRSGVAVIAALIADCIFRESDPLTSLGLSSLIICCPNPFSVFDVGMLMSFSSTAGIILYYKRVYNFLVRKLFFLTNRKYVGALLSAPIGTVSLSVCATAATMPFSMLLFGRISNVLLAANLLIVPIIPSIMILSALSILALCISLISFFAKPLALIASLLIRAVISWTEFLSRLPYAQSVVTKDYTAWCVSLAAILTLIFMQLKNGVKFVNIALVLISVVFLICSVSNAISYRNSAEIKVYSAGRGSVVSVESEKFLFEFYFSDQSYPSQRLKDVVQRCEGRISVFCVLNSKASTRMISDDINASDRVENLFLSCDEKSFEFPSGGYDMNVDFLQKDRVEIEAGDNITIELLRVSNDYWAVVNIQDTAILILPDNTSENDFELFFDSYKTYRFSIIITNEDCDIPQELIDSEAELMLVPESVSVRLGYARSIFERKIPI